MTQTVTPAPTGSAGPTLARDSGRNLIGAVVSNLANIVIIVVLARGLGQEAVGAYTLAFAVRAIALLACGLGMRTALTRFVAAYLARGDLGRLRGAVLLGVLVPTGVALLVATGWSLAAGPLAVHLFDDASLAPLFRVVAWSLPFVVLIDVALAATQGFSTMAAYAWIGQVLEPGLRLVLTCVLVGVGGDVVDAGWALLVAAVVAALAAAVAIVVMVGRLERPPLLLPVRSLAAFATTSWVATMATQGLLWADVVLLGALADTAEVGAYQVAARVVLVGMFVLTPLTQAMAPRVAGAWERGEVEALTDRYVSVTGWCARLTWPLLAGVVAVPALVLDLFGSGFVDARAVVLILSAGALWEALGAPAAVLLNQIGRNRLNMVINLCALTVNIGLNLALIPQWGMNGCAVAWATTMIGGAVVRVWVVRRIAVTRWPVDPRLLAVLGGAVAATALAWTVDQLLEHLLGGAALLRLLVAALIVLGVYGAVLWRWGLRGSERMAATRGLALRLPWLRTWRDQRRLRDARAGDEVLSLHEVVAPFRLDVLARQEVFVLIRGHRELARRDPVAFSALVRPGRYGAWFDRVVVGRGHVTGSEPERERVFVDIVTSCVTLLERFERGGLGELGKVTVTRVAAGAELEGWSCAEDRWVLLDGAHRIALTMLDGRGRLEPDDYLIVPGATPPNNSVRLAADFPAETVREFLDWGGSEPAQVERWLSSVRTS